MNVREAIRQSTVVRSSQAHTFDIFVSTLGRWWPVQPYSLGGERVVAVTVTPELGGRVFETGDDGSTATWGHVLTWEPPQRFAMTWDILAGTEVELTFLPLGPALTRVELEHRGWENLDEDQVRSVSSAPHGYAEGWSAILRALTEAAEDGPDRVARQRGRNASPR